MKLRKFPDDLPIEAVEGVTSILGTLIASLQANALFAESKSLADYQETIENLNRDLKDCEKLHEEWQHEPDADAFKAALAKMHIYLNQAKSLIDQVPQRTVH